MAKIKGVCKNFKDDCEMAIRQTPQEAEASNFVCSRCRQPLEKLDKSGPSKMVIIAAVVVVLALVLAAIIALSSGKGSDGTENPGDKTHETEIIVEDTTPGNEVKDDVVTPGKNDDKVTPAEDNKKDKTDPNQGSKDSSNDKSNDASNDKSKDASKDASQDNSKATIQPINLGFGTFIPGKNGMGTVTISAATVLPSTEGTVDAERGDKIINAKVKNGRLVFGKLVKKDGTTFNLNLGAI